MIFLFTDLNRLGLEARRKEPQPVQNIGTLTFPDSNNKAVTISTGDPNIGTATFPNNNSRAITISAGDPPSYGLGITAPSSGVTSLGTTSTATSGGIRTTLFVTLPNGICEPISFRYINTIDEFLAIERDTFGVKIKDSLLQHLDAFKCKTSKDWVKETVSSIIHGFKNNLFIMGKSDYPLVGSRHYPIGRNNEDLAYIKISGWADYITGGPITGHKYLLVTESEFKRVFKKLLLCDAFTRDTVKELEKVGYHIVDTKDDKSYILFIIKGD